MGSMRCEEWGKDGYFSLDVWLYSNRKTRTHPGDLLILSDEALGELIAELVDVL